MTAAVPASLEEQAATALARAAAYRILSVAFVHPTPARLAELARTAATLRSLPPIPSEVSEAAGTLARWAGEADPVALADEHLFLFDRPGRCLPYEGAYGPPQMAGKSALLADIGGFYRAFGLEPEGGQPETEDHLSAELEFMSVLALKEAWAHVEADPAGLEVTRRAEATFLADHLGRWAGAFVDALRTAAVVPYYGVAADLLERWLDAEKRALGVVPVPLTAPETGDAAEAGPFTCPMADGEA